LNEVRAFKKALKAAAKAHGSSSVRQ